MINRFPQTDLFQEWTVLRTKLVSRLTNSALNLQGGDNRFHNTLFKYCPRRCFRILLRIEYNKWVFPKIFLNSFSRIPSSLSNNFIRGILRKFFEKIIQRLEWTMRFYHTFLLWIEWKKNRILFGNISRDPFFKNSLWFSWILWTLLQEVLLWSSFWLSLWMGDRCMEPVTWIYSPFPI